MSAQHTPGPWELRNEFGMQSLIYPADREHPVAAVTGYYASKGQSEPNARLVAAAPELLEALRDVTAKLSACRLIVSDQSARNDMTDSVEAAVSAIAKATGSAS